jgi:predicted AAA+ superfamily ATPase
MEWKAVELPSQLVRDLHRANPWWTNESSIGFDLPYHKRWLFEPTLRKLKNGLARVTVLRGPRQVGKTTLQRQIIQHLLEVEGVHPKRIFRVQFDELPLLRGISEPLLALCDWFEARILGKTFNQAARDGERAYLFLDEVQNLADWAPQLKYLVDHSDVRVLLTGSSALRIERGRDSLAGRISTLEMGTLTLREIARLRNFGQIPELLPYNGLSALRNKSFWLELRRLGEQHSAIRDAAFAAFSERGGYPIAQVRTDHPWEEIADQLNETVIKRVIQYDLRLGERGRKRDPILLEELFKLCCRYAGQAPGQSIFVNELKLSMSANAGWQRILAYLRFLNDTLLIRAVPPLEIRLKKKKGNSKLCLCDHGLRASWLREVVPLAPAPLAQMPHLSDLAGHLAESVAGYYLSGLRGLDLAWFPSRDAEPEVDFVITVGEQRIPVEIKYRTRIDEHRDTFSLRAFIEKTVYNAPFGILVTLADAPPLDDPRIIALPLSSLLLLQ